MFIHKVILFATTDTPYFQIGESKYGKPILDRALLLCRWMMRCAVA